MPAICKICNAKPEGEAELVEHMESEHHMAVLREGETQKEANDRLMQMYPGARILSTCKCPACVERRILLKIAKN